MGHIGYELFLIVFGTRNFAGHIGQCGGQISHFILALYRKLIMHIAAGILLRCLGDLAQRNVHNLCEEDQNNQRQQKKNDQHEVRDIKELIGFCLYACQRSMDDHIPFYFIIGGDGCKYAQHFLVKCPKEITFGIIGTGGDCGIKIFYDDFIFHIHR